MLYKNELKVSHLYSNIWKIFLSFKEDKNSIILNDYNKNVIEKSN